MNKQRTNFFESHIEKIVFAVVGILCIWILISRVLVSPNYIEYDRKKFGTGGIDDYILRQAEELEDRLNRKTEPKEPYKPRLKEFNALFDSTIQEIDFALVLPQPRAVGKRDVKRQYNIPTIGPLMDVQVGHIRAVAYVPTEPVGEKTYEAVEHEAKDIDFVTVEAKFDIKEQCEDFYVRHLVYCIELDKEQSLKSKKQSSALYDGVKKSSYFCYPHQDADEDKDGQDLGEVPLHTRVGLCQDVGHLRKPERWQLHIEACSFPRQHPGGQMSHEQQHQKQHPCPYEQRRWIARKDGHHHPQLC